MKLERLAVLVIALIGMFGLFGSASQDVEPLRAEPVEEWGSIIDHYIAGGGAIFWEDAVYKQGEPIGFEFILRHGSENINDRGCLIVVVRMDLRVVTERIYDDILTHLMVTFGVRDLNYHRFDAENPFTELHGVPYDEAAGLYHHTISTDEYEPGCYVIWLIPSDRIWPQDIPLEVQAFRVIIE